MLKKTTALVVLCLALAGAASGQTRSHRPSRGDVAKFRFRPDRVRVGHVYHYLKTNIDGTKPEHVSIYVAARDRIESFKYHPPRAGRAGLVVARLDWKIFSATRLESWQVWKDERKLFATLDYDARDSSVTVTIPATGRPPERVLVGRLPFHVYNFDLASLGFALPHLARPNDSFSVGIADPTFKDAGPLFHYKGEARVSYAGEETRGGVRCRKYRIDGEGLEGRGGWLWVNGRRGHVEDIEIALPDNPEWQSFKFKLQRAERMTRERWEAFMKAQF